MGLQAEAAGSWQPYGSASGALPGKQTIHRGEMWALKAFLEALVFGCEVRDAALELLQLRDIIST